MIRVFCGDDRVKIQKEVEKILGAGYEVVEGENLTVNDMASLFFGVSLFEEDRRILVKDLGENGACFAELPKYLGTTHNVVIWETKLDKRTTAYKELAKAKVGITEYKMAEAPEKKLVFDVFDVVWRGEGKKAVEMIEKIEITNDPYMFMGLMVSQVMRKLENGDRKAKGAVKLMADCDAKMKSTAFEPWTLVKAMLLEISVLN